MSTIASLNVSIKADTSDFAKGMQSCVSGISALTVAMGVGIERAAEFGISLVKSGVFAMADMVKESIDAIDHSSKLADRLAITTQQLQGLQYAASHAGIDTETFNRSLEHMTKVIGETGISKEAAATFSRLGIDLREIQNSHADLAFLHIADSIRAIKNPMEQAEAASKIFGKTGVQLVSILREGSDGLLAATRHADELGLALDEVDIQQVELAKESFRDMDDVIHGAANTLAVELAPFLAEITHRVIDFANAHGGLKQFAMDAFEGMLKGFARLADGLELLKAGFYGFRAVVASVFDFLIVTPLKEFAYTVDYLVKDFKFKINSLIDTANLFGAHLKHLSPGDTGIGDYLDKVHEQLTTSVVDDIDSMKKHWDNFADGVNSTAVTKWVQDVRDGALTAAKELARVKKERDADSLPFSHSLASKGTAFGIGEMASKGVALANHNPMDKVANKQDITNQKLDQLIRQGRDSGKGAYAQ